MGAESTGGGPSCDLVPFPFCCQKWHGSWQPRRRYLYDCPSCATPQDTGHSSPPINPGPAAAMMIIMIRPCWLASECPHLLCTMHDGLLQAAVALRVPSHLSCGGVWYVCTCVYGRWRWVRKRQSPYVCMYSIMLSTQVQRYIDVV